METRSVTVVGLVVALLAAILAVVALIAAPEGAGDVRQEVAALKPELAQLKDELKDELARSSAAANETLTKLARLSTRVGALEREVSSLAAKPASETAEIDEEKLRELVAGMAREEMRRGAREMMERFRGAQGGRRGRGMTAEGLREELGLDEQKAEQVAELHRKEGEGVRDIWGQNKGGTREKNVELMNELRQKAEEEIAGLLTPEQMAKYREMHERERRPRGRGRPRRGNRGNRGERGERGEGNEDKGRDEPPDGPAVF